MSFWEAIWFIVGLYVLVAFLGLLAVIARDLCRDPSSSGMAKAGWTLALIFVPVVSVVVYVATKGLGMTDRSMDGDTDMGHRRENDVYGIAGLSPAGNPGEPRQVVM